MLDDATRARLAIAEQLRWVESMMVGPAGEKPSVVLSAGQARALLAAQVQAAPVLAAAAAWHDAGGDDVEAEAGFWDAVVEWRAAREGCDNQAPPGMPPVVAQAATGVSSTRTCDHCTTPLTRETAIYQGDTRLCVACDAAWRAAREG